VSKPLLFLCVGIVQYKFDSIDIEDMDYLIMRLPKLTAVMVIGMAGMFLAPFGMIIAKFGTLIAFIDKNPGMVIILAYGTAATVYFWTKWMGKVITIKYGVTEYVEHLVSRWEKFSLALLAIATVAVSLAFPFISSRIVDPYVQTVFGKFPVLGTFNELIIFVMLVSLLIILPLGLIYYSYINKDYVRVGLYLGGANVDNVHFEVQWIKSKQLISRTTI
jgi:ech hydrogenase subunit A